MDVRILVLADAAAFQALRLAGLRECPSAFASSFEEELDTPMATVAERLEARTDRAIFGAFDGQALVGVVGLQREPLRKLAHKAVVWGMFVAPQARRTGAGHKLLAVALAHAAGELGVSRVTLGVNASNAPAIKLYRSLGFEPFGLEQGFLLEGGTLHDEIYMVCVLGASLDPRSPQG